MKDELTAVGKEIPNLACNLLSDICPQFAAVSHITEFIASASNIIFADKLSRILADDNADFFEWLKISDHFEKRHDTYQDSVRQLIYNINAINEVPMLDIYANLLRSYKANFLTKDEFFRLGWILSNIFSADLLYLNELYKKENSENSVETQKLEYYGLALSHSTTKWNAGNVSSYSVSQLGIKMLSCGIDYENHDKYK